MCGIHVRIYEIPEQEIYRVFKRYFSNDAALFREVQYALVSDFPSVAEFVYMVFSTLNYNADTFKKLVGGRTPTQSELKIGQILESFKEHIYEGLYSVDVISGVVARGPILIDGNTLMESLSLFEYLSPYKLNKPEIVGNVLADVANTVFGMLGLVDIDRNSLVSVALSEGHLHSQVITLDSNQWHI